MASTSQVDCSGAAPIVTGKFTEGELPTSRLVVVSYNLHGLNQGKHGIAELIANLEPDVIMLQEHWLSPDNMSKLSDLSEKYCIFGSSAMTKCVRSGPLIGRPFGGTAIMVNIKHISVTAMIATSDRYTAISINNLLLITAYMPCVGTEHRDSLYNAIVCELGVIIGDHPECEQCLVGGDFNTNLNSSATVSDYVNKFAFDNMLIRCDSLFPLSDNLTFINESNHSGSTIDYMLTSAPNDIIAFNIIDLDLNLSDHRPIFAVITHKSVHNCLDNSRHPKEPPAEHFRWDHAPLANYYEHTRLLLEPIMADVDNLMCNLDSDDNDGILGAADRIYDSFVEALSTCANIHIPKQRTNFYKFWWSQELDALKSGAICSCRAWKDSGKPRNGPIFSEYKKCKLLYKKRVREMQSAESNAFTNDLHDALLRKSGQDFWRTWKSKFSNDSSVVKVDGTADHHVIGDKFAAYFESNSKPCSSIRDEELKAKFLELRSKYCGSPIDCNQYFDVELLSKLVSKMSNGKAAGLDGLVCEHLKFSHPIATCILSKLFNVFLSRGHVPRSFGLSYTVPIPKSAGHTRALSVDDFRGISISPVLSKLFEMAIIDRFSGYFETSDHQFGFKKNLGCREAIYSVRNVVENFISNGSTVSVCALDLSKAFDRMNHSALLIKLMKRNFPIQIIEILETWFAVTLTCVKWNNYFSTFFRLNVGVRQGGVLSPLLFAIFIDDLVASVMSANAGCYFSFHCCCIFLYADDILLLSPSISGLQLLLDACEKELNNIDMRINVNKSSCIRFGNRYNSPCAEIVSSHGGVIKWSDTCRYLGIHFSSGRTFRCNLDEAKARFFRAFNAIYSKVGGFASEDVILNLIRSKCLPILLYGTEVCPLLSRQIHSLDFSITRLFMKLFHTGSPNIVKECQWNFGFLPLVNQLTIRTANFLQKFIASENNICRLFVETATVQLSSLFSQYGQNIKTASSLQGSIYDQFYNSRN